MFLAYILTRNKSEKNRLPVLWWFYKLIHTYTQEEVVFVVDSEDYFSDPVNLSIEHYHGLGEEEQKIYGYTIPTFKKLSQYRKIVYNADECEINDRINIRNEYKEYAFKTDFMLISLANLNLSYTMIKKMGISPTSILFNGDMEYVRAFCEKNSLCFISTELGPFRNHSSYTGLFAIGGIYNTKIIDVRYKIFKKELIHFPVPIYDKKELMSMFFENEIKSKENNEYFQYDLGIAFPYSTRLKDFKTLEEIALRFRGSIIGRLHPTGAEKPKVKNMAIDDSKTSFDFINKCKRIVSYGSNITVEAVLLDKIVFDLGNNPFSWLAHKTVTETMEQSCSLLKSRIQGASATKT